MTERVLTTNSVYHRDMVAYELELAELGDVIHVVENRRSGVKFHTTYDVVVSRRTGDLIARFNSQWLEQQPKRSSK